VYFVFVLDLLQSTMVGTVGYAMLCSGWGSPPSLNILDRWYINAIPIVSSTGTPSAHLDM
jgi:hypothetical protein